MCKSGQGGQSGSVGLLVPGQLFVAAAAAAVVILEAM